jgi:GntR family transcriptional regulator
MTAMSSVPAYLRVAADLRSKIERGVLTAGEQLPSMAQLREMYGVSNTVIRDALNELRREGLVIGQQGKGVFVQAGAGRKPESTQAETIMRRLDELTEAVRRLDRRMTQLEQASDRKLQPDK